MYLLLHVLEKNSLFDVEEERGQEMSTRLRFPRTCFAQDHARLCIEHTADVSLIALHTATNRDS